MPRIDFSDRTAWIDAAIAAVQQEIEAQTRLLRNAPGWYRAAEMAQRVPQERRAPFRRLEASRRKLSESRQALAVLQRERASTTIQPEAERAALRWINRASSWRDLVRGNVADPATRFIVRRTQPALNRRMAEGIIGLRDTQPGRRLTRLEALLQVPGIDEATLRDLAFTALQVEGADAPSPTIGVMLPVRLETRFYPPTKQIPEWQLRVRIVPDDVSFDRHDPQPTSDELKSVDTFWQACNGNLQLAHQMGLWQTFVARHGGARAAWLVRTLPPATVTQILPQAPAEPKFPTLRGLPDTIELWLARQGNNPARVAVLTVLRDQIETMDLPDPDLKEARWWNSFAVARKVGLAAEIPLGATTPDDIDVLYAIGLSQEAPDGLFKAHVDKGSLALLAPGTPTNTLDGEPAAPLDGNVEHWLAVARGVNGDAPGISAVSEALTGDSTTLGPVLGGEATPRKVNTALVQALWPVLWGHAFKDIWGLGSAVHEAGLWAGEHLLPEGPLPAIRVGQQPYGLLPTTALGLIHTDSFDPPIEETLRPSLLRLRAAWAAAARTAGNVAGAATDKLLKLLGRTASSDNYAWRYFLPLDLIVWLYWAYDGGVNSTLLPAWWNGVLAEVLGYPLQPQRRYAAYGWPQDLKIPLVEPDDLPEGESFGSVLRAAVNELLSTLAQDDLSKPLVSKVPNSLLIRLLLHALIVAAAEVARWEQRNPNPVLEALCKSATQPTRLRTDARAMSKTPDPNAPASVLFKRVLGAIDVIAATAVAELERSFRAVLDTAAYRLDPWVTACATRRLERFAAAIPRRQLGLYGWVDNPRPGTPGPTAGGLLHAPSESQCYTAIILRDKAISDPEADRWQMNLDSHSVRIAERWAAGVRAGNYLQELLGREVERVVADPAAIASLRQRFPIRAEHTGRRPCDGQAVLEANPSTLGLPAPTLAALDPLRQALDVYGDLLVAEAVHHVVSGRAEIAGAAMDAAAGLSAPPDLEVLRTPRGGRTAATTVLFCLPDAASPPVSADASPTAIADPAVATWLEQQTGAPNSAVWQWQVSLPDASTKTVSLAGLGLQPCDTVSLSQETLHALVLTLTGGSLVLEAPGDVSHAHVRRLVTILGGRPALPEDLVASGTPPDPAPVVTELRSRLMQLVDAAELVRNELSTAQQGDAAQREKALQIALRWGIAAWDKAGLDPARRLEGALAAIEARLEAVPQDLDGLTAADLAREIAELATQDGRYAVLGRMDLVAVGGQLTADTRTPGAALNPLDEAWLSTVEVVRPALARLEAYQLERLLQDASAPLFVWSNRPGDPWQMNVPADPETGRKPDTHLIVAYGPSGVLDLPGPLPLPVPEESIFFRSQQPAPSTQGPISQPVQTMQAVGLVDTWTETIPEVEHTTTAGFGFNAPAARAPQAILLAVPPTPEGQLDTDTLLQIVAETRELAHARMATPDDLAPFAGALPTMMLPAMGNTGVDLLPTED